MSDGDWICEDENCQNINFARRTNCNLCGKEKPIDSRLKDKESADKKRKLGHEIGKAAADKSKGLFSADDWQCGRCGNVNWARRSTCNMCSAPKFGDNEERTGLGGGYNEREDVEYIARPDSDDEWDDFGRKKKKRRSDHTSRDESSNDSKHNSQNNSSKHKDNDSSDKSDESDEEEEDEEEGDVSKYKLESDEDEEEDDDKDLSKYDLSDCLEDKK